MNAADCAGGVVVAPVFSSSGIAECVFGEPMVAASKAGNGAEVCGGNGWVGKVGLAVGGKCGEDGAIV